MGWSLQTLLAEGAFPNLRRLQLNRVSFSQGEFAAALSAAHLPALVNLEVYGDGIAEDELTDFLNSLRVGLPNLRRLYITMSSGEIDGYLDGWYHRGPLKYLSYDPDEFEQRFLRPYGLTAHPIEEPGASSG